MTDFKDFLNQLKIRLTNPLIFSFLVSWTIINWRITLGAFFLDKTTLKEIGCHTFLDYVSKEVNWLNDILAPLMSAIIYTLISPMLRLLIQLFNTWINKKGNAQIHKVASESFIPYEIYDQLLEELQTQRKRNEEMINENILLSNRHSDLKKIHHDETKNRELTSKSLNDLHLKFNQIFDVSQLNGKWNLKVTDQSKLVREEEIIINHSHIEVIRPNRASFVKSYIKNFVQDKNDSISFIEEIIKQKNLANYDEVNNTSVLKFNHIANLRKHGNNDFLGDYNGSMKIELERIID